MMKSVISSREWGTSVYKSVSLDVMGVRRHMGSQPSLELSYLDDKS